MKLRYTVVTSIVASVALGAAAIQGLHAQAKPPVYVVVENDVSPSNVDAYIREFSPLAVKALTDGGAKFLARGGNSASIEGDPPKRVVVLMFESVEKAKAAFASPAYRDARKIGDKYAKFRIFVTEGLAQ